MKTLLAFVTLALSGTQAYSAFGARVELARSARPGVRSLALASDGRGGAEDFSLGMFAVTGELQVFRSLPFPQLRLRAGHIPQRVARSSNHTKPAYHVHGCQSAVLPARAQCDRIRIGIAIAWYGSDNSDLGQSQSTGRRFYQLGLLRQASELNFSGISNTPFRCQFFSGGGNLGHAAIGGIRGVRLSALPTSVDIHDLVQLRGRSRIVAFEVSDSMFHASIIPNNSGYVKR